MIDDDQSHTGRTVPLVLGIARLGEVDLRGWWRTHGLDRAGRFVLSGLFPRSWRAVALELDVASAARVHDELLGRPSALHLFSDHLPFRRWAKAWLAEQKTAAPDPLFGALEEWTADTAPDSLRSWIGGADATGAEPLGSGLLLGTITPEEQDDHDVLVGLAQRLAAAYLDQGPDFRPPYMDLGR